MKVHEAHRFFWACTHSSEAGGTANSQWVPVLMPQPGIDYTPDNQLIWTRRGNGCLETTFDPLSVSYTRNDDGTYTQQQGTHKTRVAEDC
ncbi:MAG: hypothetical protein F4153_00180 [Acidimicrobiia bacterium]|nr:hypothetical protein [Acidimicrobiia bacterium]